MPRLLTCLLTLAFLAVPAFAADEKDKDKPKTDDPPTVSDLLVQARELSKEGKREAALKITDKALTIDKENIDIYVLRASLFDVMKQHDKAVAAYSKIIELEPDALPVYRKRGEAFIQMKQYDKAIADFSKILEEAPDSAAVLRLRADAELMKKYDKAIDDYTKAITIKPDDAGLYQRRGEANFKVGRVKESVADFDVFLKANPKAEPDHWQRGISYYYTGEFDKGVKQFEVHKTVNPEDVENAVWHYLCRVKIDGIEKSRAGMIPIKADRRPWAASVYEMYRAKTTPDEVLKIADEGGDEDAKKNNLFYAHLYVGLFYEAEGKADLAKKHIAIAHEKYASSHYMGDVARVHLLLLKTKDAK